MRFARVTFLDTWQDKITVLSHHSTGNLERSKLAKIFNDSDLGTACRQMRVMVWDLLRFHGMVAITGKVNKNGHDILETVLVPANHTEAQGVSKWGLVIAGSLLLLTSTFICLLLLSV